MITFERHVSGQGCAGLLRVVYLSPAARILDDSLSAGCLEQHIGAIFFLFVCSVLFCFRRKLKIGARSPDLH